MKKFVVILILLIIGILIVLGFYTNKNKNISNNDLTATSAEESSDENISSSTLNFDSSVPFFENDKAVANDYASQVDSLNLFNEPIRSVYLTSYSASSNNKIDNIIRLLSDTELNAVVIDINHSSGKLAYDSSIPAVNEHNLDSNIIKDLGGLVEKLHDNNIYVIARIVVFQNTALAEARPDFALHSSSTKGIWYDSGDQAWLDPSSEQIHRYITEVSKEVSSLGFDELNFDYIRFPSDGNLDDVVYPVWDEKTYKTDVLDSFFKYLRAELPDKKLSIDVFGLTTVNRNGLGIGQLLENVYNSFDVVAPMVYPSHYVNGSFGVSNPAESPYEIVLTSLVNSVLRIPGVTSINDYKDGTISNIEIRPWLQDFDLGANYGAKEINEQIRATQDALGENAGFMLWNPRNVYTEEAFYNQ